MFEAASRPVLERLAAALTEVDAAAGEAVVTEGGVSDALFVIVDGGARVTAASPTASGGARVLADLGPGDYFGEIGVLEGIPRTATVTTTAPSRLFRLGAADFLDALTIVPPASTLLDVARARLATARPAHAPRFAAVPAQAADPSGVAP